MQPISAISVEFDRISQNRLNLSNAIIDYSVSIEDLAILLERDFDASQDGVTTEEQLAHKKVMSELEHCIRVFLSQSQRIETRKSSFDQMIRACGSEIPDDLMQKWDQIVEGNELDESGEIEMGGENYGRLMSEAELKKNERYRRFMTEIFRVHHPNETLSFDDDEDEDLIMGAAEIQIHCPVGKNIMEQPVKSKKCGHVFDRPNIVDLIRTSGGGRRVVDCPVAGCMSSIAEADLVADRQVEIDIQREIRKRREKASQLTDDAVVLE